MLSFELPAENSNYWPLADQVLVSGTNFLCGVLLARILGLEVFGAYVVAQTYLLYANTFQSSLVVAPMMTAVPNENDLSRRHSLLCGFFGYTVLVVCATVFIVQLVAWSLSHWSPNIGLGTLATPLAGAMTTFQLQDWLRRACYSQSHNRQVFVGDCLAYGGQFGLLLLLALTEQLTTELALWAMALAFLASTTFLLLATRLRPIYRPTVTVIQSHWRASKNFLVSWQLQWTASSGVILLGTGMVGPQAAGAIRAVQNLLGPMNVFFQWLDNVVPVRAAIQLRDNGRDALRSYLWRLGLIGIAIIGTFAGLLFLIDEALIVMLYGEEYRPFAILVVYQALYYLFGHAYRMASYFQRALNETRTLVIASAWWALVSVIFALVLVGQIADRGIMIALVLGEVAGLIYLLTRRQVGRITSTHCVLRRGDGSVLLLLPVANPTLLQASLRMYSPSRWTGKLYQWWLRVILPLRLRLRVLEFGPDLVTSYPHLNVLFGSLPETMPAYAAVLVSTPGPNSKLTLKLMDQRATVYAYARLAYGENAMAAVRREAGVLVNLSSLEIGAQVPRVLRHETLSTPDACYLIESAGPEYPSGQELNHQHFGFLTGLVTGDAVSWTQMVCELREEASSIVGSARVQFICQRACNLLAFAPFTTIPTCIEHGDFTPWNIRTSKNGSLFFIDWEYATTSGIPWFDALHFVYQVDVLVRRRTPLQVTRTLLSLFRKDEASEYFARFPTLQESEHILVISFLLRMLIVGTHEGHALSSPIQQTRLSVLELFLNSSPERMDKHA